MVTIELIVLKNDDDADKEGGFKVRQLQVPDVPRKGDLFRLIEGRELTTSLVVSDVLFEQRDLEACALVVFVKPPSDA